ncbi:GH92 family glycosyl hydrolase [Prevotella sp. 10(H)]|uniref:GH92 family glycosyl hydrolase n=1 Tax=Prevotella sp. 10(H) TaxID=1158294 RepID=UPI0004A73318|nr:GH92 family glycosyl hydrolase [Prevotella sp. 10(H)]
MNINKIIKTASLGLITCALFYSCDESDKSKESLNLTQYVDPYIGTGDHGHVFMGADVPFGLVQLGPTNITGGWDWTSGYHISDSTIWGFTHMHLSGTGIGDLLDIAFMPVVGDVKLGKGEISDPNSGMYSQFSHDKETAKAGYYAVHLDRYNVDVELTATKRVGFHKYVFPQSDNAQVIIDLKSSLNWDSPVETYLKYENDSTISGYRYSKGWANDQRVFFTASFSKPMKKFILSEGEEAKEGTELKAVGVFGQALFDTKDKEEIYIKVALSPVSIENAKLNMKSELPGWDFKQTIADADKAWNDELSKIVISADDVTKRVFYTALYHTMIAPSEFCDVNNDYRGSDAKMHEKGAFKNYTTFSLWDTYRAAHPLMTIIHPEKMSDIINTMLTIYKEQGKLPVWHLMGCETDCMVGNPGISVVADAILKGYGGFDKELAFEAMKNSAMLDERGLKYMKEYGYIPYDKGESEGLSKCMEYAIADWTIAQVAQQMGKTGDYEYFLKRSKAYTYYFDKSTGFMRGLSSDGKFKEPFNPFESVHRDNDYTEGNAWQYTWLVPHDIKGLVDLFGSKEKFTQKLDSLFIVEGSLGEHASPDISGLIGQYAHGNEPSHHILYMYPYIGQPWKTADKVRQVLSVLYHDKPAGLSGNEDVGQMSAWYILSALGFYQVEPAGGKYVFGSPIVNEATIKVKDGKTFKIVAKNNSAANKYIQSVSLNGKDYDKFYIDFKDIEAGGTLEFVMGDKPSETWGTKGEI